MSQKASNTAWYEDWFGQDYLEVYPHRDEQEARQQVDFVEQTLPVNTSRQILDLGCGSGRHANEMSSRGYSVTGLDLSPTLLELAKQKSTDASNRFVMADMRRLPFCRVFDVVVSFFTTFGYFDSDAENIKTLLSIESVLRPGGVFMQDYVNKSHVIDNLVPRDERQQGDFEVLQERNYDQKTQRVEKKITLRRNGNTREYFESVRLYSLGEMQELLTKAGLTLEKTFGNFDGSAVTEMSPRLILIGRRSAD